MGPPCHPRPSPSCAAQGTIWRGGVSRSPPAWLSWRLFSFPASDIAKSSTARRSLTASPLPRACVAVAATATSRVRHRRPGHASLPCSHANAVAVCSPHTCRGPPRSPLAPHHRARRISPPRWPSRHPAPTPLAQPPPKQLRRRTPWLAPPPAARRGGPPSALPRLQPTPERFPLALVKLPSLLAAAQNCRSAATAVRHHRRAAAHASEPPSGLPNPIRAHP